MAYIVMPNTISSGQRCNPPHHHTHTPTGTTSEDGGTKIQTREACAASRDEAKRRQWLRGDPASSSGRSVEDIRVYFEGEPHEQVVQLSDSKDLQLGNNHGVLSPPEQVQHTRAHTHMRARPHACKQARARVCTCARVRVYACVCAVPGIDRRDECSEECLFDS